VNQGPPIVVHCSAGIGRTGTFATLDIAIRKFEDVGRVDIRSTVEAIRSQRAFSIQMPDQVKIRRGGKSRSNIRLQRIRLALIRLALIRLQRIRLQRIRLALIRLQRIRLALI
jgi:hypothetical protein